MIQGLKGLNFHGGHFRQFLIFFPWFLTIFVQDEFSRLLIRDGSLDEAASLQKSVSEAKMVVFGDPSEQAASSFQMLGSIRLKQGRMEHALKLLTKVR